MPTPPDLNDGEGETNQTVGAILRRALINPYVAITSEEVAQMEAAGIDPNLVIEGVTEIVLKGIGYHTSIFIRKNSS